MSEEPTMVVVPRIDDYDAMMKEFADHPLTSHPTADLPPLLPFDSSMFTFDLADASIDVMPAFVSNDDSDLETSPQKSSVARRTRPYPLERPVVPSTKPAPQAFFVGQFASYRQGKRVWHCVVVGYSSDCKHVYVARREALHSRPVSVHARRLVAEPPPETYRGMAGPFEVQVMFQKDPPRTRYDARHFMHPKWLDRLTPLSQGAVNHALRQQPSNFVMVLQAVDCGEDRNAVLRFSVPVFADDCQSDPTNLLVCLRSASSSAVCDAFRAHTLHLSRLQPMGAWGASDLLVCAGAVTGTESGTDTGAVQPESKSLFLVFPSPRFTGDAVTGTTDWMREREGRPFDSALTLWMPLPLDDHHHRQEPVHVSPYFRSLRCGPLPDMRGGWLVDSGLGTADDAVIMQVLSVVFAPVRASHAPWVLPTLVTMDEKQLDHWQRALVRRGVSFPDRRIAVVHDTPDDLVVLRDRPELVLGAELVLVSTTTLALPAVQARLRGLQWRRVVVDARAADAARLLAAPTVVALRSNVRWSLLHRNQLTRCSHGTLYAMIRLLIVQLDLPGFDEAFWRRWTTAENTQRLRRGHDLRDTDFVLTRSDAAPVFRAFAGLCREI